MVRAQFLLVSAFAAVLGLSAHASCPDLRGAFGDCVRQDFGTDRWYKVGYALEIDIAKVGEESAPAPKYTVTEYDLRSKTRYVLHSGVPGSSHKVREQFDRYFSCSNDTFVVQEHEVVPFYPGDAPAPDRDRHVAYALKNSGSVLRVYVVDNYEHAPYQLACKRAD